MTGMLAALTALMFSAGCAHAQTRIFSCAKGNAIIMCPAEPLRGVLLQQCP